VNGDDFIIAKGGNPRDPFDRILIAQAITAGIPLLTADVVVAKYSGPIRQI